MVFRQIILLWLIVPLTVSVSAQTIENFSYKLVGEKIEISFDLLGKDSDRYKIELFNSLDDYTKPVKHVSGDIGNEITPGKNLVILWEAKNELGEFEGSISLKLKTEFVPFITFKIVEGEKYIMGKENNISWEGNLTDLKLELYKDDKHIGNIATTTKGKQFTWDPPKKSFTKGTDYSIKATANGRTSISNQFTLKNTIPIYLLAIPIVVIGGVVAILSTGNSAKEEPTGNSTIPEPLGPD